MTIDSAMWQADLDLDRLPRWTCPTCSIGHLRLDKDTYVEAPAKTQDHPDHWLGVCALILKCDEDACQEAAVLAGGAATRQEVDWNQATNEGEVYELRYVTPHTIVPAPRVFRYSGPAVLKGVQAQIDRASSLYWADPSAAVAALRTGVEVLLDSVSIPRTAEKKRGGERRLTMKERLAIYEKRAPSNQSRLAVRALTELGHQGAHEVSLGHDQALDAFRIMEAALEALFSPETRPLHDLMAQIAALGRHPDTPKP